jgi:hypothetical protein
MKKKIVEEDVEKHLVYMREHAERMLHQDGEVAGIVEARTAAGEALVFPFVFQSMDEKEFLYALLRRTFRAKNVTHFFTVTEAWAAMGKREGDSSDLDKWRDEHNGSIAEFPDRREVIMVHCISFEKVWMRIFEMHRDAAGKFTHLGDEERWDCTPSDPEFGVAGALLELLPRPEDSRPDRVH